MALLGTIFPNTHSFPYSFKSLLKVFFLARSSLTLGLWLEQVPADLCSIPVVRLGEAPARRAPRRQRWMQAGAHSPPRLQFFFPPPDLFLLQSTYSQLTCCVPACLFIVSSTASQEGRSVCLFPPTSLS